MADVAGILTLQIIPLRHEPPLPTSLSTSSDPSVTVQTLPAGKTAVLYPTGREPRIP